MTDDQRSQPDTSNTNASIGVPLSSVSRTLPTVDDVSATPATPLQRVAHIIDRRPDGTIGPVDTERPLNMRISDQMRAIHHSVLLFNDNNTADSFPFGYNCKYGHWGIDLVKKLLLEFADEFGVAGAPTNWITICDTIVVKLNEHLLFNTDENKIICRYPSPLDREYKQLKAFLPAQFIKTYPMFTVTIPTPPKPHAEGQPPNPPGRKTVNILKMWSEHSSRKSISGKLFVPFPNTHAMLRILLPKDYLNLYTGYRFTVKDAAKHWSGIVDYVPGDSFRITEVKRASARETRREVARHLLHTVYVWCRGYKDRVKYVLTWQAKKIQEPWWKPNTAIVLYGREGAGKSSHIDEYGSLFGEHYIKFVDIENNMANFSRPDQEHSVFAFIDEAHKTNNPVVEAKLRMLVTEKVSSIHMKFQDERKIANYIGIMMASNNISAVHASNSSRRWVVLDCLHTRSPKDPIHAAYMESKLGMSVNHEEGSHSGLKALLGFFLDEKIFPATLISEFRDGSGIPASSDKILGTQRSLRACPITHFWYYVLDRGFIVNPELNPLHPVNLVGCIDQKGTDIGRLLYENIKLLNGTGYRLDRDYELIEENPIHFIGHSWACILLLQTVYDSYRTYHEENKSTGFGMNPRGAPEFWQKTYDIFPILSQLSEASKNLRFNVPNEAFVRSRLRATTHTSGGGVDEPVNTRAKNKGSTRYTIHTLQVMVFPPISTMREDYIKQTGRDDITFSMLDQTFNGALMGHAPPIMQASEVRGDQAESNAIYKDASEFLLEYGFTTDEIQSLYPDNVKGASKDPKSIIEVFNSLANTPLVPKSPSKSSPPKRAPVARRPEPYHVPTNDNSSASNPAPISIPV